MSTIQRQAVRGSFVDSRQAGRIGGQAPKLPRVYIPRKRLWAQLDIVTPSAVTVVVAPAGAGKTLGVAGWVRSRYPAPTLRAQGNLAPDIYWLTADPSWGPEFLGELITGPPSSEVVGQPQATQSLIIIDDAHKLPLSALNIIDHELDAAPQSLHILLLSRWDLLMGNLAAQLEGNLTTIRGDVLRLDDEEAAALVRQHAHTDDIEIAQAIQERAQGWCAVLVLTARAVGAMSDRRAAWQFLIDRREISDRIVTEVFSTLSHNERHLLLCLAATEVTTVESAAILSGDGRAGEILENLEATGLLVTRLSGTWNGPSSSTRYRIHPLLAEVVRRRIAAGGVDVEQARGTVVRAVQLDIERGDVALAFDRLVAVQEVQLAADLLASEGFTIWARGNADAIADFASRYPEIVAAHPGAWFAIAITRWFDGDAVEAQRWMEQLLDESDDDPLLEVRAACVRLMRARCGFESPEAAAANATRLLMSIRATIHQTTESTAELALLCTELGITQNWLGDLVQAESNLRAGISLCQSRGLPLEAACALSHLALTEYMSGREHTARLVAEEALRAATRSLPPHRRYISSRSRLVLALSRFSDLPMIEELGEADIASLEIHPADISAKFWFRIIAARTRMLAGDLHGAARLLDMPLELPGRFGLPDHLGAALMTERAFIAALAGDESLIAELQQRLASSAFIGEAALLGGLRADLRGDRREAAALFNAAADDGTFTQLGTRAIALACEAQLLHALGDHEEAMRRLALATTETAVRRNAGAFLGWTRQGTPIKFLVDELLLRTPNSWCEEIAASVASRPDLMSIFASSLPTPTEQHNAPADHIIPMLSAREREVLRELARGSTYADIGTNLFISENTVKTHVSGLYAKLGARRRSEALAIARTFHLL